MHVQAWHLAPLHEVLLLAALPSFLCAPGVMGTDTDEHMSIMRC